MASVCDMLRKYLKKSVWGRLLLRGHAIREAPRTWQPTLSRVAPLPPEEGDGQGKKILMATSYGGWIAGPTVEGLLGAALRVRGAEVHGLLCDRVLPACAECEHVWFPDPDEFLRRGPQSGLCRDCTRHTDGLYRSLGFIVHLYSDFLQAGETATATALAASLGHAEEIGAYEFEGIDVGEHALAGALRYFGRASLEEEPTGLGVLRRYLAAAVLTVKVIRRLLRRERFDCLVFHHGIYVPQGLIGAVARQEGVRVVNWNPMWRRKTFIFSEGDTYHHTLLNEPVSAWENMVWDEKKDRRLTTYLRDRLTGRDDWIWFQREPIISREAVVRETGIDPRKPTIGLLTNVLWDAQLHYRANAFPDMLAWLTATIQYFARRPDLQLLVRVHPAELSGALPSRQPVMGEVHRIFPELPSNVFFIPPESRLSTYTAMEGCDSVLIYGTKTGVELACVGLPVIVAGEAWVRGKGFTRDVNSPQEYFAALDQLPAGAPLSAPLLERARKYAYHFIFRRMLTLEGMETATRGIQFRLRIDQPEEVQPGYSQGLDVICEGILHDQPFILTEERVRSNRALEQAALNADASSPLV